MKPQHICDIPICICWTLCLLCCPLVLLSGAHSGTASQLSAPAAIWKSSTFNSSAPPSTVASEREQNGETITSFVSLHNLICGDKSGQKWLIFCIVWKGVKFWVFFDWRPLGYHVLFVMVVLSSTSCRLGHLVSRRKKQRLLCYQMNVYHFISVEIPTPTL